jgi:hypothetical protein
MRVFDSCQSCSILLLITFFVGCRPVQTNFSANKSAVTPSPIPKSAEESKTAEGRVIRKDGWKVPMPKKRKLARTYVETVSSENGKPVEVTNITYSPEEDFYFTDEPFTAEEARSLIRGLLKLTLITEMRVKEKIFGYSMIVREAKSDAQTNDNTGHDDHPFTYTIVDFDGDGKFEAMVTWDINFKVPAWASDGI